MTHRAVIDRLPSYLNSLGQHIGLQRLCENLKAKSLLQAITWWLITNTVQSIKEVVWENTKNRDKPYARERENEMHLCQFVHVYVCVCWCG